MRREWLMVLLVVVLLGPVGCGTTAKAAAIAEEESGQSKSPTTSETYEVQSGDTLMGISRKLFNGDPQYWDEIADLNDIKAPDYTIYPGQELKLPKPEEKEQGTPTVTDEGGLSDSATQKVQVKEPVSENKRPKAVISGPTSGSVGQTLSFSGAGSTDEDGHIVGYVWDFGDGTTGSGGNVTHVYTAAGTYQVTLTVTDDGNGTGRGGGLSDSVTHTVLVYESTAMVEAEWPKKMEIDRSDSIRVSFVHTTDQLFVPTIEIAGHTVIAASPIPVGTLEAPIGKAFGSEYKASAIANLAGTAFKISPVTTEYQSLEQPRITWEWNIMPEKSGPQTINATIQVQWEPIGGDGETEQRPIWRSRLDILVEKPLIATGQLNTFSLISAFVGSMLSVPWLYERMKEIREKRQDDASRELKATINLAISAIQRNQFGEALNQLQRAQSLVDNRRHDLADWRAEVAVTWALYYFRGGLELEPNAMWRKIALAKHLEPDNERLKEIIAQIQAERERH